MNRLPHAQNAAPQLAAVVVPDPIDAWVAAGFAASGNSVWVGDIEIRCEPDEPSAIALVVTGAEPTTTSFDGISWSHIATSPAPSHLPAHPNGIERIDHVVVMAPSAQRMRSCLAENHIEIRRERTTTILGHNVVQLFAWLGSTIFEIVVPAETTEADGTAADEPASIWGLAFEASDIQFTADQLGPGAGRIKPAVQTGRSIVSIDHRSLGLTPTLVAMSRHDRDRI